MAIAPSWFSKEELYTASQLKKAVNAYNILDMTDFFQGKIITW